MQGGATAQFSAVPLNLPGDYRQVDYLDTGAWSGKAIREASRYAEVNVVAGGGSFSYNSIDEECKWRLGSNSACFHYTPNETIGGFELPFIPSRQKVPLVADYVVDDFVPTSGCFQIWINLCWSTKKYWPRRLNAGDCW